MHAVAWVPIFAALVRAANAGPPELVWEAPAGCPSAAEVLRNVERILAESGQPRTGVPAAAHVIVTAGKSWQASVMLEVNGNRTERRFEAESCDALADAAALIVALAAGDDRDAQPEQSAPPRPAPHEDSSPALLLGADGVVDWGTMPAGAAAGVEAMAGARWIAGRWRVRALAGAGFFPSKHLAYSPAAGYVNADFWLFEVSGRGCMAAAIGPFDVGPCLGGELATMHGASSAINPGIKAQTPSWFSALGSAVVSWSPWRSLVLSLRADVTVPTEHLRFETPTSSATVYQVPAVAYRAALGAAYSF